MKDGGAQIHKRKFLIAPLIISELRGNSRSAESFISLLQIFCLVELDHSVGVAKDATVYF